MKKGELIALARQFLAAIPFRKLTAAYSFDIACDIVNGVLVITILWLNLDLGEYADILKAILVIEVVAFTAWSFRSGVVPLAVELG